MSAMCTRGRRGRIVGAAGALVLCTVTAVAAPAGSLSILWRHAVLSFDNPATQLLDETASAFNALARPDAQADDVVAVLHEAVRGHPRSAPAGER